jgi:hypothetical protein
MKRQISSLLWLLASLPLACSVEIDPEGPAGGGGAGASVGGAGGAGTGGAGAGQAGAPAGSSSGGGSGAPGSGGHGGVMVGGAGSGGAAGSTNGGGGTAGAGGAGGSGGVGGAAVSFCPVAEPCKILPLGDSITDGLTTVGGYRIRLFELATAGGKSITFVGGSKNGPEMVGGKLFPRSHEGHSGWTITQIDGLVPEPALSVKPNIILLHIGTNDMSSMGSQAPARLEKLLDELTTGAPDALLVVATIIPLPFAADAVDAFNAAIPAMVEKRAKAGKHVLLVDQFEGYPEDELPDGVHPSPAGYAYMGETWYAAISRYLR